MYLVHMAVGFRETSTYKFADYEEANEFIKDVLEINPHAEYTMSEEAKA